MVGGRCPRFAAAVMTVATLLGASQPTRALEGTTAAGPIGGTDIRSAILPPPGLYGGVAGLVTSVNEIRDGSGHPVAGLNAVDLFAKIGGPFFIYVPDVEVLGGKVGAVGVFPIGSICGQLISAVPNRCTSGFGDPYVEAVWSRSFGHERKSRDPGAFTIKEGLSVALGIGAVLPIGHYDVQNQRLNGATIGNNTFDLAPSVAMTYTTPPLLFDGTEFSGKLYLNKYSTNPDTQYKTGALLDLDFAISEHIGRFQVGLAGYYVAQVENDQRFGVVVPPDGHKTEAMTLGGVFNIDLAEIDAVVRVKALSTVYARNAVVGRGVVVTFGKKLF